MQIEVLRGKQLSADACDECYMHIVRVPTEPLCYTFHREDGPACHYVGSQEDEGKTLDLYFVTENNMSLFHRLDGACEVLTHINEKPHIQENKQFQFWGVVVPEEWTQGGLTIDAILDSSNNQEQRRVGTRAYDVLNGEGAFAKATHKKTLDIRTDLEAQDALVELVDGSRWLIATDGSSGRNPYYIKVPDTTKTCVEAQMHLYGIGESVERT
jgi:hypothetical protein